MIFYIFYTIDTLLYWSCLGFSMANSRGNCKESYLSFLSSCKSPAQGLAMLKSRHIPASESSWFGLRFYPQKRRPTRHCRYSWSTQKPRFPMNYRPLVEGCIANFCLFLDFLEFLRFGSFFPLFKKIGVLGILGPPYCGIYVTIGICWEMLCLPYVGFLSLSLDCSL